MYKVLVVDDDAGIRAHIRDALGASGLNLNLTEAEDGQRALDICRTKRDFNLMVVDYNMPNMNGLEFIECVLSENDLKESYSQIPIMMYTTETSKDLVKRAKSLSKNLVWVIKPLEPNAFGVAVKGCLKFA